MGIIPKVRAFLYGGGGPQVGEVTCGGWPHLSCKRDQIKNESLNGQADYTLPKQVTSPTWGPPPPCKQALRNTIREKKCTKVSRKQFGANQESACVLREGLMSFIYNIS